VLTELSEKTRRYRLVLHDESHNLRNNKGKRWRVIRDYIERNDSLTVLLSAILDGIDQVIGVELGLTNEQQEFFLNFEIKYRMGSTDDAE